MALYTMPSSVNKQKFSLNATCYVINVNKKKCGQGQLQVQSLEALQVLLYTEMIVHHLKLSVVIALIKRMLTS